MQLPSAVTAFSCASVFACAVFFGGCSAPADPVDEDEEVSAPSQEPSMAEMARFAPQDSEGLCPGDPTNPSRDATLLLALTYGRWHYASRVSNEGETSKVTKCDSTMAYQIGTDAPYPLPDRVNAAACALARGEVVPLTVWRIERAGCSTIECGPTLGLVWYETNGSVFTLDADGKPEGGPIMTLAMVRNGKGNFDLEQRIEGMSTTTLLKRTKANLACVTPMPEAPSALPN